MKAKKNSTNTDKQEDLCQKELVFIKKLLVLLLLKLGAKQDEVAIALQLDRSTVSRWFKGLDIKKVDLSK